ncbi:hypothetical protein BFP97_07265 [Roseivirga sp. 4D4]|uniref:TlpA family protein disulfide reductase n=1 Tax=Roseivirga sp. 4D4 TaxID=1889784 RepID=UPI000852E9AA|nr:TlpA disulfide reductase family protein [Roseivirga sp. 4D4]OEK01326.1 hypothetical protein BFP97_07265 [Roseivirga sp. 4D4]
MKITSILLLLLSTTYSPDKDLKVKLLKVEDFSQISGSSEEPLIINFWATWCGPCIKEMPELVAFSKEKKANLIFISLDIPKEIDKAQKLLAEKGVTGAHYLLEALDDKLPMILEDWVGGVPLTMVYSDGVRKEVFRRQINQQDLLDLNIF